MRCISGKHEWSSPEDAAHCCNGYLRVLIVENGRYRYEWMKESDCRHLPGKNNVGSRQLGSRGARPVAGPSNQSRSGPRNRRQAESTGEQVERTL